MIDALFMVLVIALFAVTHMRINTHQEMIEHTQKYVDSVESANRALVRIFENILDETKKRGYDSNEGY